MVFPFSHGLFAVFDGLLRAGGQTGHAVGARVAPHGPAVFQSDVGAGAHARALAAADARVRGVKVVGLDEVFVIQLVHRDRRAQRRPAGLLLGNDAAQRNDLRGLVDGGDRVEDDPAALALGLDREEDRVVGRHGDAGAAVVDETLFLGELFGKIARAAHLAGRGKDEENVAAAVQGRGAQPVGQQARHLGHIHRRDDDPGLFRGKGAVVVGAQLFQQIQHLIAGLFGDALRGKGAVARRGKIQNHVTNLPLRFFGAAVQRRVAEIERDIGGDHRDIRQIEPGGVRQHAGAQIADQLAQQTDAVAQDDDPFKGDALALRGA